MALTSLLHPEVSHDPHRNLRAALILKSLATKPEPELSAVWQLRQALRLCDDTHVWYLPVTIDQREMASLLAQKGYGTEIGLHFTVVYPSYLPHYVAANGEMEMPIATLPNVPTLSQFHWNYIPRCDVWAWDGTRVRLLSLLVEKQYSARHIEEYCLHYFLLNSTRRTPINVLGTATTLLTLRTSIDGLAVGTEVRNIAECNWGHLLATIDKYLIRDVVWRILVCSSPPLKDGYDPDSNSPTLAGELTSALVELLRYYPRVTPYLDLVTRRGVAGLLALQSDSFIGYLTGVTAPTTLNAGERIAAISTLISDIGLYQEKIRDLNRSNFLSVPNVGIGETSHLETFLSCSPCDLRFVTTPPSVIVDARTWVAGSEGQLRSRSRGSFRVELPNGHYNSRVVRQVSTVRQVYELALSQLDELRLY